MSKPNPTPQRGWTAFLAPRILAGRDTRHIDELRQLSVAVLGSHPTHIGDNIHDTVAAEHPGVLDAWPTFQTAWDAA